VKTTTVFGPNKSARLDATQFVVQDGGRTNIVAVGGGLAGAIVGAALGGFIGYLLYSP
jgi:hypothetical protein